MIPKGYVRADTNGFLYKSEDTYWAVEPTDTDPGVIAPKRNAISLEQSEAEQDAQDFYGDRWYEDDPEF